ncbi:MAG: site-specific integrase [Candidatus Angelobacter sp.]
MKRLRSEVLRLAEMREHSDNTRLCYESDWRLFCAWCRSAGLSALPADPETLKLYVVHRLGPAEAPTAKVSTVERHIQSIVDRHMQQGRTTPYTPEVRAWMRNVRRDRGVASEGRAALRFADWRSIMSRLWRDRSERAVRDRAIFAIGFGGALRRAEIIGLDVDDLKFEQRGLLLRLGRSKTDQEGKGRQAALWIVKKPSVCPVNAVRAWLKVRGSEPGPLFPGSGGTGRLSRGSVNNAVKGRVAMIGLDPEPYGAHSLRAGFVTAAAEAGVPESVVMRQTGHRRIETVARYYRPVSAFAVNVLAAAR